MQIASNTSIYPTFAYHHPISRTPNMSPINQPNSQEYHKSSQTGAIDQPYRLEYLKIIPNMTQPPTKSPRIPQIIQNTSPGPTKSFRTPQIIQPVRRIRMVVSQHHGVDPRDTELGKPFCCGFEKSSEAVLKKIL